MGSQRSRHDLANMHALTGSVLLEFIKVREMVNRKTINYFLPVFEFNFFLISKSNYI